MHNFWKREKRILCTVLCVFAAALTACGSGNGKVILTTGFGSDDVFTISSGDLTARCSREELKLYMANIRDQYRNALGEDIWKTAGADAENSSITDLAVARLSKVKTLGLLAEQQNISLTEVEEGKVQQAVAAYYDSLSEEDRTGLGITKAELIPMYREYALADEVYRSITSSIQTEISDDEARIVKVESILFSTKNSDGTDMTDAEKQTVRSQAEDVLAKIRGGADFDEMMRTYNAADTTTCSVSRSDGGNDDAFTDAAFSLDTGDVSDVVETGDGYCILKCISNFDREETRANKARLLKARKSSLFGEQYDSFAAGLDTDLNDEILSSVTVAEDVTTDSFFSTYDSVFGSDDLTEETEGQASSASSAASTETVDPGASAASETGPEQGTSE